jgi:hypothetical protein
MLDAPRQDWALYEAMTAPAEAAWLRGLTPQARFAIYEDMFALLQRSRVAAAGQARLEAARWEAKLALRKRLVEAFAKLDNLRGGRTNSPHAD